MPINSTVSAITGNGQSIATPVLTERHACVYVWLWGAAHAGLAVSFEGSPDGGTTWVQLPAFRLDSTATQPSNSTGTITTNGSQLWCVLASQGTSVRVRSTAWTSGTLSVRLSRSAVIPPPVTRNVGLVASTAASINTVPLAGTAHNLNSAATTNATSVKTSAATLKGGMLSNTGAAIRYLKLYNKASAPTVGTDVPVVTIPIGINAFVPIDTEVRFSTGLAYAITANAADSDTTAVGASEVKVLINYY